MSKEIDIAALRKAAQELKLVPTEPTADMLFAMAECAGFPPGGLARFEDYWQMAMSAAPHQPAIDLNALLDRLEQAEKAYRELDRATNVPKVEKGSQNWAGMSGAVAHHLIERHAENWADVDMMMAEWADARCAAMQGEAK